MQFSEGEIITIENLLIKLRQMIPNDNGENTDILEEIINAENIVSAKLDPTATGMAQSST
ncbi:MAG: hypothetical protein ACPKPY_05070 [Nitrososphaeraceae archaeon]